MFGSVHLESEAGRIMFGQMLGDSFKDDIEWEKTYTSFKRWHREQIYKYVFCISVSMFSGSLSMTTTQ